MLKFTSKHKYKLKQCDISVLADRQSKRQKNKNPTGKICVTKISELISLVLKKTYERKKKIMFHGKFKEVEIQIANKHRKRCSGSLIIN